MINMLTAWQGPCEINGTRYSSINAFISENKPISGRITINLLSNTEKRLPEGNKPDKTEIKKSQDPEKKESERFRLRITVKKYMTEQSSPGFDFMAKWNNDRPMPLRTMEGEILQETKGMLKMHLKGFGEATCNCMRCGRTLTNPISRHYGIGPECMSKLGLVRDIDDVSGIIEDLAEIEWEGWVIKSAITEKEAV